MSLNIDCIRDVLLAYSRKKTEASKVITQSDLDLDMYSEQDLTNSLRHIHNEHIGTVKFSNTYDYNPKQTYIIGLTNQGLAFVEAVQDPTLFEEFKTIIAAKYPIYDLSIFVYGFHAYLATKYGKTTDTHDLMP
ncbi:DUF2513 domain-containing protein [Erysipelothrix anatis]|uniref:DUF2513 domain-containing protein n=1 Tax=Erysipelothrix anatis TaxID=2683713 RepID=UPI00135B2AE6|nr:DUF2513 domain-containing protein [Erysipelothrix anatis]